MPVPVRPLCVSDLTPSPLPLSSPPSSPRELAGLIAEKSNRPKRLETHVWHAKRMTMIDKWGRRLPWSATRKPSKAVIKAGKKLMMVQHHHPSSRLLFSFFSSLLMSIIVRKGCTIHDASYTQVVELKGSSQALVSFLGPFMVSKERGNRAEIYAIHTMCHHLTDV